MAYSIWSAASNPLHTSFLFLLLFHLSPALSRGSREQTEPPLLQLAPPPLLWSHNIPASYKRIRIIAIQLAHTRAVQATHQINFVLETPSKDNAIVIMLMQPSILWCANHNSNSQCKVLQNLLHTCICTSEFFIKYFQLLI